MPSVLEAKVLLEHVSVEAVIEEDGLPGLDVADGRFPGEALASREQKSLKASSDPPMLSITWQLIYLLVNRTWLPVI